MIITKQTQLAHAERLWTILSDTPVNDVNKIEATFLNFETGTDCLDIWHWFEAEFNISVATDLMHLN